MEILQASRYKDFVILTVLIQKGPDESNDEVRHRTEYRVATTDFEKYMPVSSRQEAEDVIDDGRANQFFRRAPLAAAN